MLAYNVEKRRQRNFFGVRRKVCENTNKLNEPPKL
jgi:hypothetical protein